MANASARSGPQLVFAIAGALVFVGSLFYFVARYAWGMDGAPSGATVPAVLFNVVLFTVFALHHSGFARTGAKDWIRRTWPPALERSVYTWVASLLFIGVCGYWQPVDGLWWKVEGWSRTLMHGGQLAAVAFILVSARRLDVLDLAGVRQVLDAGRSRTSSDLDTTGPYGIVRHPIYLGWVLFVWLAPTMNGSRATFALVSCFYLFIAVPFEERDLRRTFGKAYERYSATVRWRILPLLY